ncbi:MAG: AI-2E family transporter [Candidatus Obscuribacter sp.]|nr:AI-2E family transporter [Candidatus Melainabacteria bacterium]MDX1986783.1 AI-2E family transporter [Candidatus Obscuribacter sp.]
MSDMKLDQGEHLLLMQRRLTIALLSVLLVLALLYLGFIFADILRILGISILLSYLFINPVDWLSRYIKNRALSIVIIYSICAVVVVVGFLTIVPSLVYQLNLFFTSTFKQVPHVMESFLRSLTPLDERLAAAKLQIRAIDMISKMAESLPSIDSSAMVSRMTDVAMSTMTWVLYGLSILVLTFYFLLEGHRMKDRIIASLPSRSQGVLHGMARDIDLNMQSFFRGQIVMGVGFGLVMMGLYFLLGVQYALVLGLILAAWEIVPVIGPLLGFLPAALVVLINGMDNVPLERLWQVLLIVVIFNVGQWIKDNLIAPRYIGNAVNLHPVIIFISIMIGARMDGILGIVFAIPAASVVNVVYQQLTLAYRQKKEANSLSEPASPLVDAADGQI